MIKKGSAVRRANVLAALRSPLTFFGLVLLLAEGAFSAVLVRGGHALQFDVAVVICMTTIFLACISAVFFLVLRVPANIMLTEDKQVATAEAVKRAREALHVVLSRPKPTTASEMLALLSAVEAVLVQRREGAEPSMAGDVRTIPKSAGE